MTEEPEGPGYCSCELVSHGKLGRIEPVEMVSRVVCDPRHIRKSDGTLKPGIFPPSHIQRSGLSLLRTAHLSPEDLRRHADAVAGHDPKDRAVGTIDCPASKIRAIVDDEGFRWICLYDDPVKNDPKLPDNPAHATLIASREVGEDDVVEIRTRLTLAFGALIRFPA